MPDYTSDTIERIVRARALDVLANAARRADVHPDAAQDFVAEIAASFEYEPTTDALKRKSGVPENVTVNSILDAARVSRPHRFRNATAEQQQRPAPGGAGKFGGFVAGAVSGADFFALSPEQKIAAGNEIRRPRS